MTDYLRIRQVAEARGVSVSAIGSKLAKGVIPFIRTSQGIRIPTEYQHLDRVMVTCDGCQKSVPLQITTRDAWERVFCPDCREVK